MVKIKNQNLIDSDANFIILPVDFTGEPKFKFVREIFKNYPHVEKEYLKIISKSKKDNFDYEGLVQYVPADNWALVWTVDSTKNDCVAEEYDKEYKYFVNTFIQRNIYRKNNSVKLNTIRKILNHVAFRAKVVGGKVAIHYSFGVSDTTDWKEVNNIIHEVFDKYNIDVDVCKSIKN